LKIIGELPVKKDTNAQNFTTSIILKNDETLQLFNSIEYADRIRLTHILNFDLNFSFLSQSTINRYTWYNHALSYNHNLIIMQDETFYYDEYCNEIYSLGNDSLISLYFSPSDTNHNQNKYSFSDVNSKMILILPRPLKLSDFYQSVNEQLKYRDLLFLNHKYEVILRFQTEFAYDKIETSENYLWRFQIDDFGNFYVLTMNEINGKMTLEYKKYNSEILSSACKNYSVQ
jgi:hypothetical protein